MNGMRLNRSGLNMSRLNASLLNASGIGAMGCKGKATMEDRIMESMVLWYDLAKQGATNEGMAADPRIIDHSGNGHHAACHNFAWSGMSGIGGYLYDFMNWIFNAGLFVMERTSTSVHVDGRNEGSTKNTFLEKYLKSDDNTGTFTFPSFKIRVQNPNGFPICSDYYYNGTSADVFDLSESGTYTIPERTYEVDESMSNKSIALRFRIDTAKADAGTDYSNMNVTIELLPEYPGALVSDGVDDYAVVTGLPILTKEKGYTVVAKRKHLSFTSCIANKSESNQCIGGFIFEQEASTGQYARSFGSINQITFVSDDISFQTSKKYCEQTLNVGDSEDTEIMTLFLLNNSYCASATYSLLLFDRDLTDEEIEWVKTNLMSE